ncbi:MAG TPA: DegT/DnrJ/EryC1/StrS family aminotransferase [Nanoarchaeota archaeon]|nr:DegT/DnrJ/EryC1/StrS family aminotransferase [Nanoarchaeota archaeon]HIH34059.1 DegT/DnrJ/EryC1/StrS family aminotransferase [Nanoarchaeota archaeon]HIH51820.1 DegT/DnrJ/EryC1/StrS family aminotransferase [Nanoarchaeota archaeon]HIH66266.1 DegT/DnrJ/EryC1/StrS family aminotransferase [Nanoarchaeota archaeon]
MRDVRVGDVKISEAEKSAINRVLDSNWLSEGPQVKQFESDWARYVGTKYCIAMNSGTSAIIAGLEAMKHCEHFPKANEWSKVITSPLTFIATVNSIKLTNYQPAFVDVNMDDFSLNAESLKEYLEKADVDDYSAIMPVHLMGYPCDMNKINSIAKKYGLAVIEDSCEAHGTKYNGKRTGSLSDFGVFSFFIAHNIQVGELGAVTTDDLELVRFIDKVKAHGRAWDREGQEEAVMKKEKFHNTEHEIDQHPRYYHDIPGYNFKTTEIQAALAVEQIKKADWIIKRRLENVKYLNEGMEKFSDILKLPTYNEDVSFLGYPFVIKDQSKISRKKLREELVTRGIETRPLFGAIPLHQPVYSYLRKEYEGKIPNAEYLGAHALYIGCHQYLTQEDLDYVIGAFGEILGKV